MSIITFEERRRLTDDLRQALQNSNRAVALGKTQPDAREFLAQAADMLDRIDSTVHAAVEVYRRDLRDQFAEAALPIVAPPPLSYYVSGSDYLLRDAGAANVAVNAYALADAMLEARRPKTAAAQQAVPS